MAVRNRTCRCTNEPHPNGGLYNGDNVEERSKCWQIPQFKTSYDMWLLSRCPANEARVGVKVSAQDARGFEWRVHIARLRARCWL